MTEAEMCGEFTARCRASGFRMYAETGGWDLVMEWTGKEVKNGVRYFPRESMPGLLLGVEQNDVLRPGDLIGVSAKLKGNFKVIMQALSPGVKVPDFRAVLVPPELPEGFISVAEHAGVNVFISDLSAKLDITAPRWRWPVKKRMWLPPIEPTFLGGHAGPSVLSEWRVGALRVWHLLETRGWVTLANLKDHKQDRRLWESYGWIQRAPGDAHVKGRALQGIKWTRGTNRYMRTIPTQGYEKDYAALKAHDEQQKTPPPG